MDLRNIDTNGTWIRSSRCGPDYGNCVELRRDDAEVIIRDSKSGSATFLIFDHAPWSAFVQGYRSVF